MKSRLYTGTLRHRRFMPREHHFDYRVFMPYLCLDELPTLFDDTPFWSARGRALAEYRRSDFLGDPAISLDDAVRQRVETDTGETPTGPIYLLANLRYFGKATNPLACYYCFSEDESRLEYLVAEVTNTPWNERHSYVLKGPEPGERLKCQFGKAMHVSPFNPMDMQYHWNSSAPGERLALHLENHDQRGKVFDATLSMDAAPLTAASLNKHLWRYPMMSAKVGLAIYWQALKLFLKGVPLYAHPNRQSSGAYNE
ncbi:MAG: DUF1365 domain-containing protein [Pseudomonadota bacterium]